MFTYENGLYISFLLYVYHLIMVILNANSKAENNLNKVGETYSWLTLRPVPMSKSDFDRPILLSILKFLIVAVWLGLFVFLSWINVFIFLLMLLYRAHQDYGVPKEIKEFRWKLRNLDMSFDELVIELMKIKGIDIESFEEAKEELIDFVNSRKGLT